MVQCKICDAYANETIYYQDKDYFVIEAKDKKGHRIRYMICTKKHVKHSPKDYRKIADALRIALSLVKSNFILLNGVYASIKDHWHVIVCDRLCGGETVDITKEPRIEVFKK